MNNIVILETWTESEAGWGQRPDGYSIHLSKEDYKKFVENHWKFLKELYGESTPHEYDRPDNNLEVVKVSYKFFKKIEKSKFGIRLWREEFKKLEKEGQIETIL